MARTPKSKVSDTTRRLTVRQRQREEDKGKDPDEIILIEAKRRWNRVNDFETTFRSLYRADVKFAWGDSDNLWQWPNDLARRRTQQDRPCLTINKVHNHVRLVTNDMKKNKASIDVRPVNNEGDFQAAQIWEGLIRNIEYESAATTVYDQVGESMVEGGIGYWRVVTDYEDDMSFDQVIRIKPVRDQLGVYLDPDIEQIDGLDAEWGFVFEDRPRDEVEAENPELDFGDLAASNAIGGPDTWLTDDTIREAEYYRIVKKPDRLFEVLDDDNNSATFFESDAPKEVVDDALRQQKEAPEKVRWRPVKRRELQWFKIIGSKIVDRRDDTKEGQEKGGPLKGKYIPIIRAVGREKIIDGQLERKGLVRPLKDPQRMYNYNSAGQVEYGALATKSPWVGPKKAFEGNVVAWNNANRDNAAYLTYNHWDAEAEQPIPKPERPEAPGASPAFLNGMQIAANELDMAAGQEKAQRGKEIGADQSGVAISNLQRQSDIITFDFLDHMAIAIRACGKVIIDLAPHIYDTERVIQILGRDGTQSRVTIKPNMQDANGQAQAYKEQKEKDEVLVHFNPRAGKYEVHSEPGPAYSTQRQEAWNAFVSIVTGAPDLINEIGDLMFQSADFPLADKIAERLLKKIKAEKPYLFDDSDTPQFVQMRQEMEELSKQVGELLEQLADQKLKNKDYDQRNAIAGYSAETDRATKMLKLLTDAVKEKNGEDGGADVTGTPEAKMVRAVVAQVLQEMLAGDDITPKPTNSGEMAPGLDQIPGDDQPPVPGAQRAQDGHWYIQNTGPNAKTHPFMRVMQQGLQQLQQGLPEAVAKEVKEHLTRNPTNAMSSMIKANG